ncbi:hypothetical protein RYA05_02690 [Pseudomonas syringae pv. actinidiae]|nr:hypothetical protein [Pseudomonas syringae pv. actinidiae]
MKSTKFTKSFSENRAYYVSRASVIFLALAAIYALCSYSEKVNLTRDVETLPQSYLVLLDRSVRHTDMVAECKTNYALDMENAALKKDGETPSYIAQSILRCQNLESSIAKQKANIERFYSSDFFTELKAGKEFSLDEMYKEKKAFRETASAMDSQLIKFSHEEDSYFNEKVVQEYYALKQSVGDTASEPQLTSRFETIDRAISTGDRRLFMNNYRELQSFLAAHQMSLIKKELAKEQEKVSQALKQKSVGASEIDKEQFLINEMIKNRLSGVPSEFLKP